MPTFEPSAGTDRGFENPPPEPSSAFWGWRMVLAGTAVMIVSSGVGFYGHSVLLDPLQNAHHWSKGEVSLAVTLYFFTSGLVQLVVGRQIDRHGPNRVLIIGSIIFAAGMVLLSRITYLWQLYAVYLIMAVGWCCTGLVPINTLIANWFIRRRGLAMGVTMTGLSLGGVIIVPLATWVIWKWGMNTALPLLGVLYAVVVIPVALFVIKARPSHVGQVPDGRLFSPLNPGAGRSAMSLSAQTREWTRIQALRTAAFWAIVASFVLAMCGQMAFLIHQVSFLTVYLGPNGAALAISLTATASIIGRLALGSVVDRLNNRLVAMACFLTQGVAVFTLAHWHHPVILYAGTFVFGLTMGNIIMMQSLIIGECFGMISFGTIFGVASLFTMAGSAFGPWLAGSLFDLSGSYRSVFMIFAAFSLFASVAVLFAKPRLSDSEEG
jgi:MFS family permease